jgi:hypothetical protein
MLRVAGRVGKGGRVKSGESGREGLRVGKAGRERIRVGKGEGWEKGIGG